ncbi:conserved protein of unknown function precursor containing a T9SS type A C-terminal secretion signal [Tenacibaculum sp. 190524A02b]|uniref:leucine-rich repeat domain-containing protein n=1 Tax=Tenacibaculum vairaonense TaxID=3137860 RepID=UPI0032B2E1BB
MKKIIPLLFMCLTIISYAQTTAIPDPNFEQALIDLGYDDVVDGAVLTTNISTVKNLFISRKGISDLTGIEEFTALENLNISQNINLKKLDLSKNTALIDINSYGNFNLESFDLSKNTKLKFLNLGYCGLTSIDVSIYPELISLYLQSNKLTSIDLSKNIKLTRLSLSNNKLEELDLTNQTKLGGKLELAYNLLNKIDISTNLDIQALTINNNQLKTLDVSLHTKLVQIDVSNNSKLEHFNIKNGTNTKITSTYFKATNLPRLGCIQVDDSDWSRTNWTNIGSAITFNENCPTNLEETSIPDTKFEQALIDLGYDDVIDGSAATGKICVIKNLNISNKEISNLTGIEAFKALEHLDISQNYNLKELDLSKNTALKNLFGYGNFNLESFDLSKNINLEYLNLGNCGVTSIDLSTYTNLKHLYLQSNKLTAIDLSKNLELMSLSIENNKIEELNLTNQTKLSGKFNLGNNLLKVIDLSTNLNIVSLEIYNNQIKTLDLSLHTKLLQLNASNNPLIESLNLKNGTNTNIKNQYFEVKNTPRLTCIQVDDATWSTTNWKNKDVTATYNENCEPITWSGNVNSNWNLAENWLGGTLPSITDRVLIPSTATNFPTINQAITVNNIEIESGATLIANATVTGNAIYRKKLLTSNWYLMASPLVRETIQGLIAKNSLARGTNNNLGLAFYDNTQVLSKDRWRYQQSNSTGSIHLGKGFSVKLSTPGVFSFEGSVNPGNTAVSITKNATPYNLIGNPYLALVKSQSFLTRNTASLESETIWVWNQATNSYDTKVTADNFNIATGQAFFVKSKATTGTVNFQLSDQTHGAETFQRKANDKSALKLLVSNGEVDRYTKIYFIASATKGFDNGYDGELFSGVENKFEVYSELLENNKNKKYQIQSIPTTEEHTIIPIGIKASAGETIKFSIENKNNLKNVYLEDKEKKLLTELDNTTENYSVTLSKNTNGTGRFYLHTSSKETLGNNTIAATPIKINHIKPNLIKVEGINDLIAIEVYTLQGKTVIAKNLKHNNTQLMLPKLASGVYIVKVKAKEAQVIKKIILK